MIGTLGRTRTANPLIRSQILYPLSYEGTRTNRTVQSGALSRLRATATSFGRRRDTERARVRTGSYLKR